MNEAAQVKKMLSGDLGINLTVVDASDRFLSLLASVEDPEQKRKIIGNTFIHIFQDEAARIESAVEQQGKGKIEYLLQGTLYPDVIESISFKGPSATIKTHHNVGGLLKDMKLKLIEPLRELFKGLFDSFSLDTIPTDHDGIQTKSVLLGDFFRFLPISLVDTPSLVLVLRSESSAQSPALRSRFSKRPIIYISRRYVQLDCMTRSLRHLQFCSPFGRSE